MKVVVKNTKLSESGLQWSDIIDKPGVYRIYEGEKPYVSDRMIIPHEGGPLHVSSGGRLSAVTTIHFWHRFTFIPTNESIVIQEL